MQQCCTPSIGFKYFNSVNTLNTLKLGGSFAGQVYADCQSGRAGGVERVVRFTECRALGNWTLGG